MNGPDLVREFLLKLSQYFFLKIWYIITEELKAGIVLKAKNVNWDNCILQFVHLMTFELSLLSSVWSSC
jgi:hypothetical protein